MRRIQHALPALTALVFLVVGGCGPGEGDEDGEEAVALLGDEYIQVELEAFRRGLPPIDTLSYASASLDELVERFQAAMAAADTAAFPYMALTRQEFAWMYYPHTRYTTRPYELPADVVWMNLHSRSSRGLARALSRYSGLDLPGLQHRCPEEPEVEGPNRFWHGCVLWRDLPSGERIEERAFGSIWERDGRFKLVSFTNEY